MPSAVVELVSFGLKEARACLFPIIFFGILIVSHIIPDIGIARYDLIFLAALAAQVLLLLFRLETGNDALVFAAFHGLGLILELFKTHPAIHSWSYPEPAIFKIATVPLYSGFMYAAVASYICRAWRTLNLDLLHYPPYFMSVPLSLAIYLNFFSHHFLPDMRWWLIGAVIVVFWRSVVLFEVTHIPRRMPLVMAFALIGFFIWIAENLATYYGAWVYPDQTLMWTVVAPSKITSWFLLVIVSFLIVADVKHVRRNQGSISVSTTLPTEG